MASRRAYTALASGSRSSRERTALAPALSVLAEPRLGYGSSSSRRSFASFGHLGQPYDRLARSVVSPAATAAAVSPPPSRIAAAHYSTKIPAQHASTASTPRETTHLAPPIATPHQEEFRTKAPVFQAKAERESTTRSRPLDHHTRFTESISADKRFPYQAQVVPPDSELHRDPGATIAAPVESVGRAAPDVSVDGDVGANADAGASADQQPPPLVPDFDDTSVSYASFSTGELVRAYLVLQVCAIGPLVDNSEALLKIGYATMGETLTNSILGSTFFAHFCAGETADQVGRRAADLRSCGVGGILDYAAEVDLRPAEERAEREARKRETGGDRLMQQDPAQCRTYNYMGEEACDARTQTFLACIRAVRDQTPGGFAAIKLTALGDPVLLSQLTTCVHLVRGLFEDFDVNQDGVVSKEEFAEGYKRWFVSESDEDRATLMRTMKRLDPDDTGGIDYVEWSNGMGLDNLAEITANCRNKGPMAAAALDENGVALKEAMQRRISSLATAAAASEVRLMIDAEQSWLQPAIDNTVYGLQREFNTDFPTIYTTYQCYLKDSLERLSTDLDRAARGGYVWAGKLVRGAYMVSERAKAEEEGYESPVFETIDGTHANFDAAVRLVLEHMARGNRAEVMFATHNQASIEGAIALMRELGIAREDGVSFGQLLGMADNITFPLGARGYKAYKYIPYGKVGETIPYLLRRAQENSGMLGGASHERGLLAKEIGRRIFG